MKFIVDRMLGRLTTWLRLLGYDTVSVSDFDRINSEDDFLLDIAEEERILITRDRTLKLKKEDYVPDRLMDVIDFWVCDNCGQVN
ncbi:MAG: Mut7-C RNAse domain-containing protein [Methanocellales archaeon]|nr:Mut7-C RNAse domain-containing protein [Methanocellales archaeon]